MSRFYTADELNDLDKSTLEIIADTRGLQVEGSGANGNVVIEDLVAAIGSHQDRTGLNPAIAAELEPDTVTGTWKVAGIQETLGHQPGETFTGEIPTVQAGLLLAGGHIIEIKES